MNDLRILAFDTVGHDPAHARVEIDELRQRAGAIIGTNDYFGLSPDSSIDAHEAFFRRTIDRFDGPEPMIVLGIEPVPLTALPMGAPAATKAAQVLQDAAAQSDLAIGIGAMLRRAQAYAADGGKRLRVVVRIASEMNEGNVWSRAPFAFVPAYNEIASNIKLGAEVDPVEENRVRFSFAPGIHRAVAVNLLPAYWPGAKHVDLIGCTWYTRLFRDETDKDPDGKKAFDKLKAYFLAFHSHGLDYGIDELGCCESSASSEEENVPVYRQALARLRGLPLGGRGLHHAVLFTVADWKVDLASALA